MEGVTITNKAKDGSVLQAVFYPERGMNMVSYKRGAVEIIDQGTRICYEERYSGLGPLVGPHFHHRYAQSIPQIKDEKLFPSIAFEHHRGETDPFPGGIARYVPWRYEATATKIKGEINGEDVWKGVSLAELEGQHFKMFFEAEMCDDGLHITLSIFGDKPTIVGTHHYYSLSDGEGFIVSDTAEKYYSLEEEHAFPSSWEYDHQRHLTLPVNNAGLDMFFRPHMNPLSGNVLLKTKKYNLRTVYNCVNDDNCWHLYHPRGSSYVVIGPLSSKTPSTPHSTGNFLKVRMEVTDPEGKRDKG
jgi:hypothetical protein